MSRIAWITMVVGCNGPKPEADPEADTDTDADSDSDTDTDSDTDIPETFTLTGITSALNETVGTVVVVGWEQSAEATVHLEFEFDAGVTLTSPERTLSAGHHEELLLGIPYDTDATWRIVAVSADGTVTSPDAVTRTAPLPVGLTVPTSVTADETRFDADLPWLLVSQTSEFAYEDKWTMVLDRQGRAVWGLKTPPERMTMHTRLSSNGDSFLIDHNSLFAIFDGGAAAEVAELKIDGSEVHRFATPGLHQPFAELPDGSLVYSHANDPYYEEYEVTVVARDGSVSQMFDCAAWVAGVDPTLYCAANSLSVDPVTGNVWMTLYSISSVVEIDPTTGTALRWFGNIPGSWAFDPPSSVFEFPHSVYVGDAGTLLVSDFAAELPSDPIIREYTFDPANETLTEIFRFGEGEGIIGYGYGDVFRMPNGNTQQNCGVSRIREVTPEGDVVWDIEWVHPVYSITFVGRSTPFADLYAMAPERP